MSIKGYKAYEKGMICRGFQYEEGKTYTCKKAKVCKEGFHLCENPLDVFNYYDLCDSEFSEVEALGKVDKRDNDSKLATTKIKIGVKLSLSALIKASVNFLIEKCKPSSGGYSQLASSGYSSQLASSGGSSQLASSGDSSQLASSGGYSRLEINGEHGIAAGIGVNNVAKGKRSNWLVLAEWKDNKPVNVKAVMVDGKIIKEDIWYRLYNGEFIEVNQ